ncbi:hypothetical protein QFC19_004857 [Naganishia cerealis]|uniref:Uncharacterized protein n=1 Tax=Naganishia cerealis TaxID=610337 RepID=A0ACC2VTL9_9TREE|nr:hypothetical protein QFC19_004857 [Naganishia cerealis]
MFRRIFLTSKYVGRFVRANSISATTHETALIPIQHPRLRPFLFSKKDDEIIWKKISLDTYPSPLFGMSSDDIRRLKMDEYLHLIKIPYKWVGETEQFCTSMAEIIDGMILDDTETASIYYFAIDNSELKESVNEQLRMLAASDTIKESLVEMMIDHTANTFRSKFFQTVAFILKLNKEKQATTLLSYLDNLRKLNVCNEKPLILNSLLFERILRIMPREKFAELYAYLVILNIQTYVISHMEKLKHELLAGLNLEKLVAKTGLLNPKWHDIRKPTIAPSHITRMRIFFSVRDLARFATHSIEKRDIVNANMYVSLLVTKFEEKCKLVGKENYVPRVKDSDINTDILLLLKVLLNHVMVFKGSQECLRMMQYMVHNNVTISFDILMIIMKNLRNQGYFQEALLLMNNIRPETLTRSDCLALTDQILCLIQAKYPTTPKIMFGYVAAVFKDGIKVLNKLKLLGLVYQDGSAVELQNPELRVQRANIDERLGGFNITPKALTQAYEMCLSSLHRSVLTSQLLKELYDTYIETLVKAEHPIFKPSRQNDHVVTLIIKYLLKENPENNDMCMVKSEAAYSTAKDIIGDYFSRIAPTSRRNRSPYLFDLLITTALSVHRDYEFATKMVRESRSLNLPFTFNQIYPFIMYHYEHKEYKKAELWYQQLVKHGVKSDAEPSKNLFKVARELGWEVNGFVYRKLGIHRNYKKKEELKKLLKDPIVFIKPERSENETDAEETLEQEFLDSSHRGNFSDELLALIN